jgi:hypothetical protein
MNIIQELLDRTKNVDSIKLKTTQRAEAKGTPGPMPKISK